MTCAQVQELVATGDPLPEVAQEHLDHCPTCQGVAQRWAAARRELTLWRQEPLPPFLQSRLMAAVRQAAAPPPWWRRLPRTAWAGAALAALLVGVLATQGVLRLLTSPPLVPLAAPSATPTPGSIGVEEVPLLTGAPQAAPQVLGTTPIPPFDPARYRPKGTTPRQDQGPAAPSATAFPLVPALPKTSEVAHQAQQESPPSAPAPLALARAAPESPESLAGPTSLAAAAGVRPATARQGEGAAPQATAAASSPPAVRVALLAATGEEAFSLALDPTAAPPPTQVWVVVIHEDGGVTLEGPPGQTLTALTALWQRALLGAGVPPGRYRAVRSAF